eukprot:1369482-Amorphochlora_amoeboformis.AAC.1
MQRGPGMPGNFAGGQRFPAAPGGQIGQQVEQQIGQQVGQQGGASFQHKAVGGEGQGGGREGAGIEEKAEVAAPA